jgi:hypothetical protein
LLAIAVCGWYSVRWSVVTAQFIAFWAVQIVLDAAFVVYCWRITRVAGPPPSTRRFWRSIGLAGLCFLAGDTVQTVITLRTPTMASTTGGGLQAGLVATGVLVCLVAMLTHPVDLSRQERLRFGLDAGTVMTGASIFVWYFSVSGAIVRTSTDLAVLLIGSGLMLVCAFSLVKLLLGGNAPFTRTAGVIGSLSAGLTGLGTGLAPMLATMAYPGVGLAARLLPCILLVATPGSRRYSSAPTRTSWPGANAARSACCRTSRSAPLRSCCW